ARSGATRSRPTVRSTTRCSSCSRRSRTEPPRGRQCPGLVLPARARLRATPTRGSVMAESTSVTPAPVILVPGFWLGAWAWDEVAADLRAAGCDVRALTLPGLEPDATDRASVSATDHVEAICAAVEAAERPPVLAVHSGAGFAGYAASDRVAHLLAAMVYVDTAPGVGAMDPGLTDGELPLDWESL